MDYIKFHQDFINKTNHKLKKFNDRKIFLFGAHVQAQYLIGFGLNLHFIEAILDNDKNKQGKRLYGTNKFISSPLILAEIECPIVIVRAGTFSDEIISQIKEINPKVEFIS